MMEQLNHLNLLKISGSDAISFLQGQLTNDVSQISKNWQLSAYCNPKGRVLSILRLFRHDDDVFAIVNKSVVETIVKRLRMYVLRSNVTIDTVESCQLIGSFDNSDLLELATLSEGDATALVTTDARVSALVLGRRSLLVDWDSKLEAATGTHWQQCDIAEGVPDVSLNSSEIFVPQMLNLDIIGGISFKKGCYTGQEIVARIHYLGKLKQRMFVCTVANPSNPLQAGDKIVDADNPDSHVGNVVSAVAGSMQALAVLRLDRLNDSSQLVASRNASLTVQPQQPYSIPS